MTKKEEQRLCPLLLNGWIAHHGEIELSENLIESCKCRQDCRWYYQGGFDHCALSSSFSSLAEIAEMQ